MRVEELFTPADDAPDSPGRDLFQQYIRREISHEQYLELSAIQAADLCHLAKQAIYLPLPQFLADYVKERINNIREHDDELGRKLGAWIYTLTRALDSNIAEAEHLLWAKAICDKQNARPQVLKLDQALARIQSQHFPYELFKSALAVQTKDAIARERRRPA